MTEDVGHGSGKVIAVTSGREGSTHPGHRRDHFRFVQEGMERDPKETTIYVASEDVEPLDSARPEKRLLKAILLSALSDLKKPGDPSRQAVQYFLNPNEEYIFSFRSVCNFLEIDPGRVLRIAGLSERARTSFVGIPVTAQQEQ